MSDPVFWWEKEGEEGRCAPKELASAQNVFERLDEKKEREAVMKRYELLYPILKSPGAHRETCRKKVDKDLLGFLWERLACFEDRHRVDSSLYRMDCYGNVVSFEARRLRHKCAPGYWVADHRFAWARGGLTVEENLHAVQWQANARKGERVEQCIQLQELGVGIQKHQFLYVHSNERRTVRQSTCCFCGFDNVRDLMLGVRGGVRLHKEEGKRERVLVDLERKQDARFEIMRNQVESGQMKGVQVKANALVILQDVMEDLTAREEQHGERACFSTYRVSLINYISKEKLRSVTKKDVETLLDFYQTKKLKVRILNKEEEKQTKMRILLASERGLSKLRRDRCIVCKKPASTQCSLCKKFSYCGRGCQLVHWEEMDHHLACNKV